MVTLDDIIPVRLLPEHIENPPSCTTRTAFDEWHRASIGPRGRITPKLRNAGFCSDCTPEYQRRMRTAGMCDHYEEIRFYRGGSAQLLPYDKRLKMADRIACEALGL